ncbi:MAG: hypothetical protein HYZ53_20880 [Planctomycetes bacterium]|nr:hypothetical protein [Planctomycetota bacterium]
MKPIEVFQNCKQRADLLVNLYHLLHNRRKRSIRSDWAHAFLDLMHWPKKGKIQRVDGANCVLIVRMPAQLSEDDFRPEVLSELLRAALTSLVAALDRYVHEVVLQNIVKAISKDSKKATARFRNLRVPVTLVKEALDHARRRRGSGGKIRPRPMNIIKRGLQEILHAESYQSSNEIAQALARVGITDLWRKCASRLGSKAETICARLDRISRRRNWIAHEGDIERHLKGGQIRLREISEGEVRQDILWIEALVGALEGEVASQT